MRNRRASRTANRCSVRRSDRIPRSGAASEAAGHQVASGSWSCVPECSGFRSLRSPERLRTRHRVLASHRVSTGPVAVSVHGSPPAYPRRGLQSTSRGEKVVDPARAAGSSSPCREGAEPGPTTEAGRDAGGRGQARTSPPPPGPSTGWVRGTPVRPPSRGRRPAAPIPLCFGRRGAGGGPAVPGRPRSKGSPADPALAPTPDESLRRSTPRTAPARPRGSVRPRAIVRRRLDDRRAGHQPSPRDARAPRRRLDRARPRVASRHLRERPPAGPGRGGAAGRGRSRAAGAVGLARRGCRRIGPPPPAAAGAPPGGHVPRAGCCCATATTPAATAG